MRTESKAVIVSIFLVACASSGEAAWDSFEAPKPSDASSADSSSIAETETVEDDACVPSCEGLECGSDGCGGVCAACANGMDCVDGHCVCPGTCDPKLCGVGACGDYCAGCLDAALEVPGFVAICDESTGRCVTPEARCDDGWCFIPAGSFLAGDDPRFDHFVREIYGRTVHPVVLTRSYFMQATEVTEAAYQDIMGPEALSPSHTDCGPDCPMRSVTVFDAMRYANRLGEGYGLPPCYVLEGCAENENAPRGMGLECIRAHFEGPDCLGLRLPSEAEWEHAARAGSRTCSPNGRTETGRDECPSDSPLGEVAIFCGNSEVDYEDCTYRIDLDKCIGEHPVASLLPNAFGLYDTSGNVRELTGTVWYEYGEEIEIDPGFDPIVEDVSVSWRGGCAGIPRFNACSATRFAIGLDYATVDAGTGGFRLVRTAAEHELPEP